MVEGQVVGFRCLATLASLGMEGCLGLGFREPPRNAVAL